MQYLYFSLSQQISAMYAATDVRVRVRSRVVQVEVPKTAIRAIGPVPGHVQDKNPAHGSTGGASLSIYIGGFYVPLNLSISIYFLSFHCGERVLPCTPLRNRLRCAWLPVCKAATDERARVRSRAAQAEVPKTATRAIGPVPGHAQEVVRV